ncbi:MAG: histidine phosphotransferase [Proteobacteria bacterium]|nr:histidine phosphotransferase [Pseudomonadota bacterium]
MSQETQTVTLDALDLAALLSSRVCHDVINPVGAILNGLEVMEDDKSPETQDFAISLIRNSAKVASGKLQFCRIAFGAAGSAGASVDLGDAEKVTRGFIDNDKIQLTWNAPRLLLAKNKVKLLLNLVAIAAAALLRGGAITVDLVDDGTNTTMAVIARGPMVKLPAHTTDLIAGVSASGVVDAHSIQPYYAGLVARASGMTVTVEQSDDGLALRAASTAA